MGSKLLSVRVCRCVTRLTVDADLVGGAQLALKQATCGQRRQRPGVSSSTGNQLTRCGGSLKSSFYILGNKESWTWILTDVKEKYFIIPRKHFIFKPNLIQH